MAQLPPVLSLLLALLYVCSSDLRKGTNSKHLYRAEIEWDLLFRPQSSGESYSESEAYAVLEELAAILATFRSQVLILVKRTKEPLNLHNLTPLEVAELILSRDRPLVRRMKVPQNLHHLPPLGVVGLVLPIELKKNLHYRKNIIYCSTLQYCHNHKNDKLNNFQALLITLIVTHKMFNIFAV